MGFIYVFRNNNNSHKCYIGQTQNIKKRFINYKKPSNNRTAFDNAIKKYTFGGFDKFIFSNIPNELLDYFEIELIKRLNTLSPNGYNLESGGCKNKKMSPETKLKMSESRKRLCADENYFTDEHRKNISNSKRGVRASIETKLKMSIAHSGKNNHNYGKKHSGETRKKISTSLKGRSVWNTGKHLPEWLREKISIAKTGKPSSFKGKHHTDDSKKLISLHHADISGSKNPNWKTKGTHV